MRYALLLLTLFSLNGCIEQNFTDPDESAAFDNNARPLETEWIHEQFRQPAPRPADILFSIDRSCSMREDEARIREAIPRLTQELDNLNIDYHVGVMSTNGFTDPELDYDRVGILGGTGKNYWITPDTNTPDKAFQVMMDDLGTPAGEAGLTAFYTFLIEKRNDKNHKGFLRENSPLHLVVISDEDDQGWVTQWELSSQLRDYEHVNEAAVTASALVASSPGDRVGCGSKWAIGSKYMSWVTNMEGGYYNLCDEEWEQVFNQITEYTTKINSRVYLQDVPIEHTLTVNLETAQGNMINMQREEEYYYSHSMNAVVFNEFLQDPDEVLHISYFTKKTDF